MVLLQTNQQIRFEVTGLVLRRLGQRFNDAKVDVMYVQHDRNRNRDGLNTRLCATWLSVPFPTTHLNSLHVQLRFFQSHDLRDSHFIHLLFLTNTKSWEDCVHWLGSQHAEKLLEFVHMSLRTEAGNASSHDYKRFPSAHESLTTKRTIQKLVIDLPFESDSRQLPGERVRCELCPRTSSDFSNKDFRPIVPSGKRAALVFAQSLHEQLLEIFNYVPADRGQASLLSIFFQSIGSIELNVQGRLFQSLELSQILARMPRSEEWNEPLFSRAEFFEWKRAVEVNRKAAGFEVIEPSVQEHDLAGSAGLICSILAARDEFLVPLGTLPTNDATPPTEQLAEHEGHAFTRKAIFVDEDGTKFTGDATFHPPGDINVHLALSEDSIFGYFGDSLSDLADQDFEEQSIEEQPWDGEHVVLKGEAILIVMRHGEQTITSGDATFYGRAEDASTE